MAVILTVTLNAACDVTYAVKRLTPGESHAVSDCKSRAGGKGLNVARLLHGLGQQTVATGLVGGLSGTWILSDLAESGLQYDFVQIAQPSRRTVTIVDQQGQATVLNEPGPQVTDDEWREFCNRFIKLLRVSAVVVLSGSLPPSLPRDGYGQLITFAHDAHIPVLLDSRDDALVRALPFGPAVVMPNASELTAAAGLADPWAAANMLRRRGARNVIATLGRQGMIAVTTDGAWQATPPSLVVKNETGAGDAAAAAVAIGLRDGTSWPDMLRRATEVSAAAVLSSVAGTVEPEHLAAVSQHVLVESITERNT